MSTPAAGRSTAHPSPHAPQRRAATDGPVAVHLPDQPPLVTPLVARALLDILVPGWRGSTDVSALHGPLTS